MKRTIKNKALAALTLLAVSSSFPIRAQGAPLGEAAATVPLAEYLELKKKNDLPSVTTIEEIYLSGVYGKELNLAFSGTSSGQPVAKPVFDYTDAFSLHDCSGDAIFDLNEGSVSLLPLQKRFRLSCKVSVKNWAELEMNLRNALFFRAQVVGAEVITDSTEAGIRKVVLSHGQRSTAQADAVPTATGRYLVTALPDETRFNYTITVTNPNRGIKPFEVRWPNGERVQKIHTTAEFSESDGGVTLKLPPGDTAVLVQGSLSGAKFEPPLRSEHQFVMIENHPTLQLTVDTDARRIGPRDAQMTPAFPSARAYLAGKETRFSWTSKKLELFSTLGFSVKNAHYLYYVPENGKGIVEAQFQFDNQGTPEIPLEVPGTASYLEINGAPQVLYKNGDGKLVLQLGTGLQNVLLQYRTEQVHRGLASAMSVDLARPQSVLSNATLQLRTPEKWSLLYGGGLHHMVWDYSFAGIFLALLLGSITVWLLAQSGFERGARRLIAFAFAFLIFLNPGWALYWGYAVLAGIIVRNREALIGLARRHVIGSILSAFAAAFGLVVITGLFHAVNHLDRGSGVENMMFNAKSAAIGNYDGLQRTPAPAPPTGNAEPSPTEEGQGGFQGLPARIEIPQDGQSHFFNQGLIDEHGQVRLSAVMVGMSVLGALSAALGLAAFAALTRRRALLLRALRI